MKSKSKVNLEDFFRDKRGIIYNLINLNFGSCLFIKSKNNTIRANHYHKKDWHYCYILKGKVHYYSRKVGSNSKPRKEIFKKGDLFFTAPMVEHALYFPINTEFIALAKLTRKSKNYEKDTVRINLI